LFQPTFPAPPGYDQGNLSWLAALEAEPASDVMALLPWARGEARLTGPAAQARLRGATMRALRKYAADHGLREPRDILDAGCSGELRAPPGCTAVPDQQGWLTSLTTSCACSGAAPGPAMP
jgi:hypothetical protein